MSLTSEILVPGKTFLLGEYLALVGGPSLLAATRPCFRMQLSHGGLAVVAKPSAKLRGFHPQSPAALLQSRLQYFPQFDFADPYAGAGGLGASTAQFLAVLTAHEAMKGEVLHWLKAWHLYRELTKAGDSQRQENIWSPSGADIVAQCLGQVTYFDSAAEKAESLNWAFKDLHMSLFRTGQKLATHEHLSQPMNLLTDTVFVQRLRQIVRDAQAAFVRQDAKTFAASVNEYAQCLEEKHLVAEETQKILQQFRSVAEEQQILAAKGCGAMGADIILVLHAPGSGVRDWAKVQNLKFIASEADLTEGLHLRKLVEKQISKL